MCADRHFKPVGGLAAVAVVPPGAAAGGPDGLTAAAARAEWLPLVDDMSHYDETADCRDGIMRVEHRLTVALPLDYARRRIGDAVRAAWAAEGVAAIVDTASGERLAVGWSERFGTEQPLRLTSVEASTAATPHQTPVALLTFRSIDSSSAASIEQTTNTAT